MCLCFTTMNLAGLPITLLPESKSTSPSSHQQPNIHAKKQHYQARSTVRDSWSSLLLRTDTQTHTPNDLWVCLLGGMLVYESECLIFGTHCHWEWAVPFMIHIYEVFLLKHHHAWKVSSTSSCRNEFSGTNHIPPSETLFKATHIYFWIKQHMSILI